MNRKEGRHEHPAKAHGLAGEQRNHVDHEEVGHVGEYFGGRGADREQDAGESHRFDDAPVRYHRFSAGECGLLGELEDEQASREEEEEVVF